LYSVPKKAIITALLPLLSSSITVSTALTAPKTAVIIQADSAAPVNHTPDITPLLTIAMRSCVDYYLFRTGRDAATFLVSPEAAVDSILKNLAESGYNRALFLHVRGRNTQRTVVAVSPRRVRYFTKQPGYLELKIKYTLFVKSGGTWTIIQKGQTNHSARRWWPGASYQHNSKFGRADSGYIPLPEPFDHILQRSISEVMANRLTTRIRTNPAYPDVIPTVVLVDSSFIQMHGDRWRELPASLLELVSWWFSRQFGYGFEISAVKPVKISDRDTLKVKEAYYRFLRRFPPAPDTLTIAIGSFIDRFDLNEGNIPNEIGLSQVGQKRILVSELPKWSAYDDFWRLFPDGLTLLHEIGHAFGAVHVSDMNSVMSHQVTWVAADRFDAFNRRIIQAALSGELTFDDPVKYVRYVSRLLSETRYNLVDYPAFFHFFLTGKNGKEVSKKIRMAVGRQPYLTTAQAYELLMSGDKNKAAWLLRQAIKQNPRQASLYYYLAVATSGDESDWALRQSAGLGFFLAQIQLQRKLTEASAPPQQRNQRRLTHRR
jgi:hypothetical protein